MDISPANVKHKEIEPIQQILALGAPYPMVVLPVDCEYWMEGTYHILSKDMHDRPIFPALDLSRCTLTEDNNVYNYRRHFVGKEHFNFACVDSKYGPVLLSVLLDLSIEDTEPDHYRVILRLKDRTIHKILPTTVFDTDLPGPRDFMKFLLEDDIDVDRFHPVAIPRANEDITKFDEHTATNCYKVGIVYQKFGQTSEEDYLQNQEESPAFCEFLELLGHRVELKDFPNYRGGLDVKYGHTGDHSYYTNYKNRELMFHVSTSLPYTPKDSQQLNRKRHIGNDVVSIIFQEENTPFCPNSIRSHFLHVFIIVQVENPNTKNTSYKVSVTAKEGVPKFAPSLPTPCIFRKGPEFRNYLLTKIINAEIAAFKSERFSALAERTRTMLLQGLVGDFIIKTEKLLEDDNIGITTNNIESSPKTGILSSFRSALHRSSHSNSTNVDLAATKLSGQSLSLNDLSALDLEQELKKEPKRNVKDKKKGKKDKSTSSSTNSITTLHSRSPTLGYRIAAELYGDTSPVLKNTSQQKAAKSRFYPNILLDINSSQSYSLPRNIANPTAAMNGHRCRTSPPTMHQPRAHLTQVGTDSEQDIDDDMFESESKPLGSAQMEIEKLKAEINQLKIDKMDLVKQNVMHRRELKKRNQRATTQNSDTTTSITQPQIVYQRKHSANTPELIAKGQAAETLFSQIKRLQEVRKVNNRLTKCTTAEFV